MAPETTVPTTENLYEPIETRFRRQANGWHHVVDSLPTRFQRDRGPLAVISPDNRLKTWGTALDAQVQPWNGVDVHLVDQGNGLYVSQLTKADADKLRYFRPTADATSAAAETRNEPIDACIEGIFDENHIDDFGYWVGRFDDLPEWMGDDVEISVSGPDTGGSPHQLYLIAPDVAANRMPPWLRVNGVWCLVTPADHQHHPGHWILGAVRDDVAVIRTYEGEALPNDDTLPIRTRRQIRPLFRHICPIVRGHMQPTKEQGREYRAWRAAATVIEYGIMGVSGAQGQANFYRRKEQESAAACNRKRQWAHARFAKAKAKLAAYANYDFQQWLDETQEEFALRWMHEADLAAKSASDACRRAESIEETVATKLAEIEAAEAVVEPLEAKYADIIRQMYLH